MNNICLIVRSYKRPEYLIQTLRSLLNSDIDICKYRFIYDDGSKQQLLLRNTTCDILKNKNLTRKPDKEFNVIFGKNNQGCHRSFITALSLVPEDTDYIITLDNDVIVHPKIISKLLEIFNKASQHYSTNKLLLTGFNPTNAHQTMVEDLGDFYRKKTCGAVNYFFHKSLLNEIIMSWETNNDHSVGEYLWNQNIPLCCTTISLLNHIGKYGISSNGNEDCDINFKI